MARRSRMEGWRNQIAGNMPGAIVRFIIFVPFGIYQEFASNHWDVIKDNEILHSGIYNPLIARGEHMAAKWGMFGFYWNFAAWLPTMICPAPFSIVFGAVDTAVAVMISLTTHFQTGYSPHDVDRCKGSPGTHEWQRPAGVNESFFDAAARLNATTTDSFHMCKSFVQEWQYGVTLSVLYSLLALINIFVCIMNCIVGLRKARQENGTYRSYMLELGKIIAQAPLFLAFFLIGILWYIPAMVFRCLPIKFKAKTRYARRWGFKAGQKIENQGETVMKQMRRKADIMKYQHEGPVKATSLAEFLSIYDMLIVVTQDLHYTDVINLSLASKSVREAVLPAQDYVRRLNHFRMYTCDETTKRECWSCTNQICVTCQHTRDVRQTDLYFHMDNCIPYCASCYYHEVQRYPPGRRLAPSGCQCAPPSTKPNWVQRYHHGEAYYQKYNHRQVTRTVCSQCNVLPDAELEERREERTKFELKDPDREGVQMCVGCEGELGRGPRWWVCKGCWKECSKFVHVAWGRRKNREEEAVVGEDAV